MEASDLLHLFVNKYSQIPGPLGGITSLCQIVISDIVTLRER